MANPTGDDGSPSWTSRWNKAEKDYDEAAQALDNAFQMESVNEPYVQHLQKKMQNAQKVKELLLQSKSQSSEAQNLPNISLKYFWVSFCPLIPTTYSPSSPR